MPGTASRMSGAVEAAQREATGPLRVHAANPRYFADPSGRAVYLTGSHTWAVVQDAGPHDPPAPLDWSAFLGTVRDHGHNFVRLWTWEHPR